jgi:hypothetical protein
MRSSTGMIYNSALDVPHHTPARASVGDVHRGGRTKAPEAQLLSSVTYRGDPNRGGAPISKHEYKVPLRQRRNTLDQEVGRLDPSRVPLNVVIPSSPNRSRPIVSSSDRARSPISKPYREDSYLVPASSTTGRNHRRMFSADGENDANLAVNDRDRRPRAERQYRDPRPERRAYPMSQQALVRYKDADYKDNYSYTTPREEFDRDSAARSAARLRPRRESYTPRDRPMSVAGMEGWIPPRSSRDGGPPVTSRGFDRIPVKADDDIDLGRRYSVREPSIQERDANYDIPKRRRLSQRAPVSLHQERDRDEGYNSYREDYDDKRERPRRPRYDDDLKDIGKYDRDPPRRHSKRDEESSGPGLGTAAGLAGVGLTAVGIASSRAKEPRDRDYDDDDVRRDRKDRDRDRRPRDDPRDDRPEDFKPRDRRLDLDDDVKGRDRRDRSGKDGDSNSETSDRGHQRYRRHRRDRDRDDDKVKNDDDQSSSSSSDSRAIDPLIRDDPEDRHRRREERRRRHRDRDERDRHGFLADEDDAKFTQTPLKIEGPEPPTPRRVELVSPPVVREPEQPVKGILKTPKEKFPEDANAIREGVAPLKDAGKKGIPPGARWTKIDRRLVNPAALEEAHERFEERPDFVIVLRVLTKEEIQDFAVKTQEIRGKREQQDLTSPFSPHYPNRFSL